MSATGQTDPMKPAWMAQAAWDAASYPLKCEMHNREVGRPQRDQGAIQAKLAEAYDRGRAGILPDVEQVRPTSARRRLLVKAANIIDGDRNHVYGGPEKNFERIAALATAAGFGHSKDGDTFGDLEPHHVALLMILVKVARLVTSPTHEDSWLDTAGYAGCGWEVAEGE